jgi:hypothetical protein
VTGFKRSSIKKILRKKINHWIATLPTELVPVARKNTLVCGGAIASLLQGETPNDYDIYFKTQSGAKVFANHYVKRFNEENTIKSIVKKPHYVTEENIQNLNGEMESRIVIKIKSAGVAAEEQTEYKYFELESQSITEEFFDSISKNPEAFDEIVDEVKSKKEPYRPMFLSDNAISLANKMQLIIRFSGDVEEIHKNFDYVHAMCAYDYEKDELLIPQESIEAILSKTLVYKGSLYPIASVFRIRKFVERGWRINAGQILKICWQIGKIDFTDIKMLREQLIGVDMAYMRELISAIENEKDLKKIDDIYISKLVDEIFG